MKGKKTKKKYNEQIVHIVYSAWGKMRIQAKVQVLSLVWLLCYFGTLASNSSLKQQQQHITYLFQPRCSAFCSCFSSISDRQYEPHSLIFFYASHPTPPFYWPWPFTSTPHLYLSQTLSFFTYFWTIYYLMYLTVMVSFLFCFLCYLQFFSMVM